MRWRRKSREPVCVTLAATRIEDGLIMPLLVPPLPEPPEVIEGAIGRLDLEVYASTPEEAKVAGWRAGRAYFGTDDLRVDCHKASPHMSSADGTPIVICVDVTVTRRSVHE